MCQAISTNCVVRALYRSANRNFRLSIEVRCAAIFIHRRIPKSQRVQAKSYNGMSLPSTAMRSPGPLLRDNKHSDGKYYRCARPISASCQCRSAMECKQGSVNLCDDCEIAHFSLSAESNERAAISCCHIDRGLVPPNEASRPPQDEIGNTVNQ